MNDHLADHFIAKDGWDEDCVWAWKGDRTSFVQALRLVAAPISLHLRSVLPYFTDEQVDAEATRRLAARYDGAARVTEVQL